MNRYIFLLTCQLFACTCLYSQNSDSTATPKYTLTVGGGVDTYYAYDINEPASGEIPYFVSSNKHNQFAVNLAYVNVEVQAERFKLKVMPAFGSYMNANYAAEEGLLKALYEATGAVKLAKKKELWLEAGVLSSPYSSESAMSKDQMMYTRSFSPEYVPYYLGGARLWLQQSAKLKLALCVVNGWQQLKDVNSSKSIGTQVEWKPKKQHLINWNTYVGDERSEANPLYRTRIFNDIYWVYSGDKHFSTAICAYYGMQLMASDTMKTQNWYQVNVTSKYTFTNQSFVAARVEYFNDDFGVQIKSASGQPKFSCLGASVGYSIAIQKNAFLRFEVKELMSVDGDHFVNKQGDPRKNTTIFAMNLSAWF